MTGARLGSRLAARVGVGLVALGLAGCAHPGAAAVRVAGATRPPVRSPSPTPSPSPSPSPSPTPSPSPSPSVDPGTLPQTTALPTTTNPTFQHNVALLWQAIVTDRPAVALPFFFPLSAYLQVKAIANPAADWQTRLVATYELDIEAVHAFLAPDPAAARLVSVTVPTAQAEWIKPGVEWNKGSYWRVFGTRVTVTENGQTRSFGIRSLISWRGQWYVVHLGPIFRSVNQGEVYQPLG